MLIDFRIHKRNKRVDVYRDHKWADSVLKDTLAQRLEYITQERQLLLDTDTVRVFVNGEQIA